MSDEKILLLASEDQFSGLANGVFEACPLRLFHADTLENALLIAQRERPEMILLVADLPGLDAVAGCAAFKRDDELCSIPVVVLTAGVEGDTELFREAECDDCLAMPIDRNKFLSYLRLYIPLLEWEEERVPCYSQVTIRDDDDMYYGMTGDISGGGLFVAAFDRLPSEGEIRLSFTLPDTKITSVETKGRVVWRNSKTNPVSQHPEGFGVEFTNISREEYLAIIDYIASARKKTKP
jgi:two-component system cell cycle response regulator DivK